MTTPKRKSYLKRSVRPPRSQKKIRARKPGNPRRRAGACREYLDWLKEQPCVITGKRTGFHLGILLDQPKRMGYIPIVVDPTHVRVKRLGGDLWNALSLAHHLHEELHAHGIKTFAKKYGVDLKALATEQTEEWLGTAAGRAWETGA